MGPYPRFARLPADDRSENAVRPYRGGIFLIYYFTLPVLVGYWPELMKREVWGVVNWAYLFAFSQFLMAWTLAYLYMRVARRFDQMSEKILAERTLETEADDGQGDD